ncbi:MAG: hypothetical protein OER96_00325 [Gammaproteobacteria bacterium]|nr:hypothetical protein [Gammaproteobacteria bacterium]
MPRELTRKLRAELRELHSLAWERELAQGLTNLEQQFRLWKEGKLDAFELSDKIHSFHNDESRKLYSLYSHRYSPGAVPSAIARGIVDQAEGSDDLFAKIAGEIQLFREAQEETSGVT